MLAKGRAFKGLIKLYVTPIRREAANIFNKQSRTADKGWSSKLEVGLGANKSSPQKAFCYEVFKRNEMGRARRAHRGEERRIQGFGGET